MARVSRECCGACSEGFVVSFSGDDLGAPTEQIARVTNVVRTTGHTAAHSASVNRSAALAPRLNIPRQCEALLITDSRPWHCCGDQCCAKAVYKFQDRAVCWVHRQACTKGPRSTGQSAKVEFVGGAE